MSLLNVHNYVKMFYYYRKAEQKKNRSIFINAYITTAATVAALHNGGGTHGSRVRVLLCELQQTTKPHQTLVRECVCVCILKKLFGRVYMLLNFSASALDCTHIFYYLICVCFGGGGDDDDATTIAYHAAIYLV